MSPSPVLIDPPQAITRCHGCGAWVWHIDTHGCNTCRTAAARS